MKKTKIIILTKCIDGGTGTFIFKMKEIEEVLGKKIKLKIAILRRPKYRKTPFPLKDFYYFESSSSQSFYHFNLVNIFIFIKELFWLDKLVRIENPTAIISIDIYCSLLLSIIKIFSFRNFKTILTFHNNISAVTKIKTSFFLIPFLRLLGRFFFRKADTIIGISKGVSHEVKKFFFLNKPITTIYYGISSSLLTKSAEKPVENILSYIFSKKYKKIISIGRFEIQKDFITLINAFKIVQKKIPRARLILIGDGYEKQKMEQFVELLYLQNSVFFLGWKENIFPYLKRSDIFALSSNYEGFGFVLLEAMSVGLPVISTDTPYGPREILDNGKYGVLVPMKDLQAMAKAMYELLTNEKKYRYYSQKSLERVKFFSLDKMLKAYKKVILNLINKQ